MTEPRGEQGFAVAPQPLGGSGGPGRRRRRLAPLIVTVLGFAIVGVAWLGPRLTDRPYLDLTFLATPKPSSSATPEPTRPDPFGSLATALPTVTRGDGTMPAGQVAIGGATFQILDVGTGSVTDGPTVQLGLDAIVPTPDGPGWWCVCMVDVQEADATTRELRLRRIGTDGMIRDDLSIAILGSVTGPDPTTAIQTDLDLAPDHRSGILAVAMRHLHNWTYSVARIDLVAATLGPLLRVGSQALPKPAESPRNSSLAPTEPSPADVYLDGPYARLSPDGSRAFVWSTLQRVDSDGNLISTAESGWVVSLDGGGTPVDATLAPAFAELPLFCSSIAFGTDNRLLWLCPVNPNAGSSDLPTWSLGAINPDGTVAGRTELPSIPASSYSGLVLDTANGLAYAWDPIGLTLLRIDTTTLSVTRKTFDALVESAPGYPPLAGLRPSVWRPAGSAVTPNYNQIVGGPGANRLYLLGFGATQEFERSAQPSLGVFVVDPTTLALVDRWTPLANDVVIQPALGGSLIAVSGQPNVDAQGRPAAWQGSLTFYDTAGRLAVRFGALGVDNFPLIIGP